MDSKISIKHCSLRIHEISEQIRVKWIRMLCDYNQFAPFRSVPASTLPNLYLAFRNKLFVITVYGFIASLHYLCCLKLTLLCFSVDDDFPSELNIFLLMNFVVRWACWQRVNRWRFTRCGCCDEARFHHTWCCSINLQIKRWWNYFAQENQCW